MRSAPTVLCDRGGDAAPASTLFAGSLFYTVGMNYFKDPVLLVLAGLLVLTVTAFLAGVLPYPFGILVLLIFIVARLLFRQ